MIVSAFRRSSGALQIAAAGGLVALLASAAFAASPSDLGTTYRGAALPLGAGSAQAWVSVDAAGQPQALGVSLTEAALEGIEAMSNASLSLPLPAEAAVTGFDHVFLNWNPQGHPPAPVWGTPHFDVHFYRISPAEREEIAPDRPDFAERAARHPDPSFLPAGYFIETDAIPGMGVHWADESTPELNGEPFTHTLMYGSWDGEVRFVEPMIGLSVLASREAFVAPIRQPERIAEAGRYPTSYRIDFDAAAGEHRIVLEGLVTRD